MKLKLIKPLGVNVFFLSDLHLGHTNICRGTTKWTNASEEELRDFDTVTEMNNHIIDRINCVIGPDDIIFLLGDFAFGSIPEIFVYRSLINCKTIHFIPGNHDDKIMSLPQSEKDKLFTSISDYIELDLRSYQGHGTKKAICTFKQEFVLMHYPIQSWRNLKKGVIHLHGHSHLPQDKRLGLGKMMDVGIDGNSLDPLSLLDIMTIMSSQPIRSNLKHDHHEKDRL